MPSWLAIADKAIYLCAAAADRTTADCVQLGNLRGKDIVIVADGLVPKISIASSLKSSDALASFAVALKSGIQAAGTLLRQRAGEEQRSGGGMTTMEEDIPIVEIPGTPPDIPVVEIPGTPESPDPGSGGGIITVPIDIPPPEPGGPGSSDCGNRGLARSTVTTQANGQCPSATPEELLERCYAAVDTIYYQVAIPNCQRWYPEGSRERTVCYEEAIVESAEAKLDCRRRILGGG